MEHLSSLNQKQKEAVLHKEGPLLILAGAGSGKTRVITFRILHLIKQGVDPSSILAITFTNKAAKEMKDRIMTLLTTDRTLNFPISFEQKPFVSTFHSLGAYLLRENHTEAGLPKNFTVFDRNDSISAVKEAIRNAGLDIKQHDAGKILGGISRRKNEVKQSEETNSHFARIIASIMPRYQEVLNKEKAVDFDDLLLKSLKLFDNPQILHKYQNQWRFLHVDEYQDTNTVQYMISKKLSDSHNNICVVGDADQNIYSWRGADIRNILSFEEDFKGARVVHLEENYRSTANIINAANTIITNNKERHEKNLFTQNIAGEKITLREAVTEKDEATYVADEAGRLINEGVSSEEIAVFYRANFQSRVLEEAFLKRNIPYQVLGTRFFERKEVKDIMSYITAALNRDNFTALKRIINTPPRGIGKLSLLKILSGNIETLTPSASRNFQNFTRILNEIREKSTEIKVSELVLFTAKISGIEESLKGKTEDDLERLFNIKELAAIATKHDSSPPEEGILKFMEEVALSSDQDELKETKKGVKLMTVHASKGLEFDYCFIVGLEEKLFPMSMGGEMDNKKIEEERRLFYVALTRARKKVYLAHVFLRTIFGSEGLATPSRFIGEIPSELLDIEEQMNSGKSFGRGLLDDIDF
jgi:DNA helicase II / ATP-dependent DNA helicase PcrA